VHDHGDALDITRSTGALLLTLREQRWPCHPEELGRLADRMAGEHILHELPARRPDDAVRSEETGFSPGRTGTSRVWIVDPLDVPTGTGSRPRLDDGASAAGDPARSRQATVLIAARPRHPLRR
jgi:3'(2'), 5'-bisphosphate nucleotidase